MVVAKEIEFQIVNTIREHPTLRRGHKRFRQELEKAGNNWDVNVQGSYL